MEDTGAAALLHEERQRRRATGLVLSGGGARAAYQVGVLKAIAELARATDEPRRNPFPILVGTSAGAINAAALAARSDNFQKSVRSLVRVWENFRAEQVYLSDSLGVIRTGAKWLTALSIGWAIRQWSKARPRSLLDNAPLDRLLSRLVPMERIAQRLADGCITALAVTASSYSSGLHVSYFQSRDKIAPWTRSQRISLAETITTDHLLASSAIPFIFPARPLRLNGRLEYFGDGSMRQSAPISPAIHLGAERVLVIGAGRLLEPEDEERKPDATYPTLGQIAGHALSSIFLDALTLDIERLLRVNRTISHLPTDLHDADRLRPIDVLVISPSERLDDIAARHISSLPLPVRGLLRGFGGGGDKRNAALASYLLFEKSYTRELIDLGYADTMKRKDEVLAFISMPSHLGDLSEMQRQGVQGASGASPPKAN
jgi:NTE family protein